MKIKKFFIDPFLVTGITISVFISLILYLTGTDTAISILIALVGSVVTLQIDLFARIDRLKIESNEAQTLYMKIHSNIPFVEKLLSLLDRAEGIKGQTDEILLSVAKREIDEVNENLRSIELGRVEVDYWHSDLLLKCVERSQQQIRAVSPMEVDRAWWKSAIGRNYLQIHCQALERKVSIIRIFPVDIFDDEAKEIMESQYNIGIKVYYLPANHLTEELQKTFVLFDRYALNRTVVADNREMNFYSVNRSDIDKYEQYFLRTLALATLYEPNKA